MTNERKVQKHPKISNVSLEHSEGRVNTMQHLDREREREIQRGQGQSKASGLNLQLWRVGRGSAERLRFLHHGHKITGLTPVRNTKARRWQYNTRDVILVKISTRPEPKKDDIYYWRYTSSIGKKIQYYNISNMSGTFWCQLALL